MIAKRILRPKAASNFARLGAYILQDSPAPGETEDGRTFGYILTENADGGRVGTIRVSNCHAQDPALAIREILATQALNKRSQADRTYHLVASFEPGEQPTPAQIEDIENKLCAAIGLQHHQRISAVHTDRAHLHLHIAINKIAPGNFRCVEPYYDKRKLMIACAELEKTHGLARTNHGLSERKRPRGRQADLEAYAAEASFVSWVKAKIEAPLLAQIDTGASWAGVHALLGKDGLTLTRRGAGLVIADAKAHAVKASAVNRAFSLKELTARLGPFQPGLPANTAGTDGYGRAPLGRRPAAHLYADYVRQREAGLKARRAAREATAEARRTVYAAYTADLQEVRRSGPTPTGKQARRREIRLSRSLALAQLAAKAREESAAIAGAFPLSWVSYLQMRARSGDTNALDALRAARAPSAKAAADFLTAPDAAAAQTVLLQDAKPIVRRNGEVLYKLGDGGAVTDEARRVRVDRTSYQAAFLALTLGAQRFAGQALIIDGTETFKQQAVEVAAALKLTVTFANPDLEEARQALVLNKAAALPPPALTAFIAEQNGLAHGLSSGYCFRLWSYRDAGSVSYRGQRTLKDGSTVLLLRQGSEILVKPASEDEARKAAAWPPGAPAVFDRFGRIAGRTRQ